MVIYGLARLPEEGGVEIVATTANVQKIVYQLSKVSITAHQVNFIRVDNQQGCSIVVQEELAVDLINLFQIVPVYIAFAGDTPLTVTCRLRCSSPSSRRPDGRRSCSTR